MVALWLNRLDQLVDRQQRRDSYNDKLRLRLRLEIWFNCYYFIRRTSGIENKYWEKR